VINNLTIGPSVSVWTGGFLVQISTEADNIYALRPDHKTYCGEPFSMHRLYRNFWASNTLCDYLSRCIAVELDLPNKSCHTVHPPIVVRGYIEPYPLPRYMEMVQKGESLSGMRGVLQILSVTKADSYEGNFVGTIPNEVQECRQHSEAHFGHAIHVVAAHFILEELANGQMRSFAVPLPIGPYIPKWLKKKPNIGLKHPLRGEQEVPFTKQGGIEYVAGTTPSAPLTYFNSIINYTMRRDKDNVRKMHTTLTPRDLEEVKKRYCPENWDKILQHPRFTEVGLVAQI
jgi:hypothetical protein